MTGSDGRSRLARRCVTIPASEIQPGDEVEAQGSLRRVVNVVPQVLEFALVVHLDRPAERDEDMRVPLFEPVTVWRIRRAG